MLSTAAAYGGTRLVKIELDDRNAELVKVASEAMARAVTSSPSPAAVAKRLTVIAVRHRNKGRLAAIRNHPFSGVCEAIGLALSRPHAYLDENEPRRVMLVSKRSPVDVVP